MAAVSDRVQVPLPAVLAASLRRMHSLQTVPCGFAAGVGAPARAGPGSIRPAPPPRAGWVGDRVCRYPAAAG